MSSSRNRGPRCLKRFRDCWVARSSRRRRPPTRPTIGAHEIGTLVLPRGRIPDAISVARKKLSPRRCAPLHCPHPARLRGVFRRRSADGADRSLRAGDAARAPVAAFREIRARPVRRPRARVTFPAHPGGVGAPPPGHYEPGARSSLTEAGSAAKTPERDNPIRGTGAKEFSGERARPRKARPDAGGGSQAPGTKTPRWSAARRASFRQRTRHASPGVELNRCAARRSAPLARSEGENAIARERNFAAGRNSHDGNRPQQHRRAATNLPPPACGKTAILPPATPPC
jgi:hypothetical protein